jgi:hypothetical protein
MNYLLKRFQLQSIVTKLQLRNYDFPFKIETINPAYTSQLCNNCGNLDKNNRKNQAEFLCCHCGYAANADVNASINIKERLFDNDIKKLLNWFHALKEVLDFDKLKSASEALDADVAAENDAPETNAEAPIEEAKPKKAAAKKTAAPKTAAPKNTAAPKANTKGAGASKTSYRPKAV